MKTRRPLEKTVAQWPRIGNPAPRESAFRGRSMRVLIADDNLQLIELLAIGMRGKGYVIDSATDGEAAWERLCAKPYDLLITDNEMPRLKGLDLVRRMRERSFIQPVILISGKMHWSDPELFRLLAPGTALSKPFSISELLRKVKELIPCDSLKAPNS